MTLPVHRRTSVTSTNDAARELIESGCPDGTLVIAEQQTAGRGRRGRSWFSPPSGNVYLSYVHKSHLDASRLSALTLDAAVAVASSIEDMTGLQPTLKWPNDLLAPDDRKIAGVLTELHTALSADAWPVVVVGVGVNVNLEAADIPADIADIAVSLRMLSGGQVWDADALALTIGRRLREKLCGYEAAGGPDLWAWRRRFAMAGRVVEVSSLGRGVEAEILGLADDGGLRVRRVGASDEEVVRTGEILLGDG